MTVCLVICLVCIFKISAQQAEPGANPAHRWGNADAKNKLEIFVDFQCPTCATFNEKLKALKAKYPNDILIVFRHRPLAIPIHDKAVLAAKVAEAAGRQGKFWEMYDLLLDKQKQWSKKDSAESLFIKYAKKLGLDTKVFKADLESEEIANRVALDLKRAASLNVNSTPTVFLNDKKMHFDELGNLEEIISKDNK